MKTRQYIIATLIALILGIVTIHAQPARRSHTQDKRTQPARQAQNPRVQHQNKTSQPARQAQNPRIQHQNKTSQPARQAQEPRVQHQNRTSQPARQAQNPRVQHQNRTSQPARQAQNPSVQHQNRTSQSARQAQNPRIQHQNRTSQPARQAQEPRERLNRTTRQSQRSYSSRSTTSNQRSTHSRANSTISDDHSKTGNARLSNYSNERYYGGYHYHNAYPARNVRFHYHYATYINNYHVLYYPSYTNIYWTRNMYLDYHRWYPKYYWRYSYGYRLQSISVFETKYNLGEVAMVYGRIYSTWHNVETDDYLLFFGGEYPYQQFTVVLPGYVARRFSWRPERYFLGEHLTVTGLITTFDGTPEIIVKNKRQVELY